MAAQKPEGTQDLYGPSMAAWREMERRAARVFGTYDAAPIETPMMEQLNVFVHGIGESTDVVRKELFRAVTAANYERVMEAGSEQKIKPSKRFALRPEGTAGVVRAAIEHTFIPQGGAPVKLWYAGPMFRGERVQKGRLREFHQIGVEAFGSDDPALDAECIVMLMDFYEALGLDMEKVRLHLNSMGDPECRAIYREAVRTFIHDHSDDLCEACNERADTNPLRAFDCKNEGCRAVMADAPLITDYLCDECAEHYAKVKGYLREAGISYVEDPTLVRGLDYYTRTVFEAEYVEGMGAQSAIGGGGRYDGLFKLLGGKATPGIGFAVGYERIMLALESQGTVLAPKEKPLVFVASVTKDMRDQVFGLCLRLRRDGIRVEADYQGRSLKSQLKLADKKGAAVVILMGPDELEESNVTLRTMADSSQTVVSLDVIEKAVRESLS